ncbi:MAG TPA: AgmX/PglI C-terminal domain-containing protein [Kofleriaceae bacterium]|nr:AgmX/PglI C-terminal domain-containing protein [Kofleriaceae bacterium]
MKHALVGVLIAVAACTTAKREASTSEPPLQTPSPEPGAAGSATAGAPAPQPIIGGGSGLVEDGELQAMGNVDKLAVKRVVRENLDKLQYCYEKTLLANPGIAGSVIVKFTIAIEGSVSDVTATGVHPEVEACVVDKFRTFKFPRPQAGTVEVTYPFTFKPA